MSRTSQVFQQQFRVNHGDSLVPYLTNRNPPTPTTKCQGAPQQRLSRLLTFAHWSPSDTSCRYLMSGFLPQLYLERQPMTVVMRVYPSTLKCPAHLQLGLELGGCPTSVKEWELGSQFSYILAV